MSFKSSPETEAEIATLIEMLRVLSVGDVIGYGTMSEAIGRDTQGIARLSLIRARKTVEKEDGIRLATVFNTGVKRLAAEDIPGIGSHARRRIGRTAKTAYKRLSDIRGSNVSPEVQRNINVQRSLLGAITLFTGSKAEKRVEKEVDHAGSEIPIGRTLEVFK